MLLGLGIVLSTKQCLFDTLGSWGLRWFSDSFTPGLYTLGSMGLGWFSDSCALGLTLPGCTYVWREKEKEAYIYIYIYTIMHTCTHAMQCLFDTLGSRGLRWFSDSSTPGLTL